jgi:hypothetical protein
MARHTACCSAVIMATDSLVINAFNPFPATKKFLSQTETTSALFGNISGNMFPGHLLSVRCNYLWFSSMKSLNYHGNKQMKEFSF